LVRKVYGEENITPDNVLAVAGVAGGVSAALLHLRKQKPDCNFAVLEPSYTYHSHEVERAFGRFPVVIPALGQDAAPNWPELKRLVEANEVHGVIVTNPLNPTGKVYSSEEIHMLLGLADSHGLFVIFDECYLDMIFDGNKHVSPFITGLKMPRLPELAVRICHFHTFNPLGYDDYDGSTFHMCKLDPACSWRVFQGSY